MKKSLAFDPGARIRRAVKRQERKLADDGGGRRTPASGGLRRSKWVSPGVMPGYADANFAGSIVEAKLTTKDSISVKKEWWARLSREALMVTKLPIIQLKFSDGTTLAVMSWSDFERVRGHLEGA